MSQSLTYLGTFDDVVQRYPWDAKIDDKYLKAMIVRHVLFGGRLLLNDGYLVMHPLMQQAIREGATSPLMGLIEEGYVSVLSGKDNIVESVEVRAASGVASFRALMRSPFWAQSRDGLIAISERLAKRGAILRWPRKDMGDGFRTTLLRARRDSSGNERKRNDLGIRHAPHAAVAAVFDQFEAISSQTTQALRTEWEAIVLKEAERARWTNKKAMARELMGLANEAYHFNFASCLSAERPEIVGVDTRHSDAFDELLDTPEITYEQLKGFSTLNAPRHPAMYDVSRLRAFVLPGYKPHDMKKGYIGAQERYLKGLIDAKQYDDVSDEYAAFIAEYFGAKYDSKARGFIVSIALFAGTTVADFAGAAPGAGAVLGAVALFTEQFVTPHILRKLSVKQLKSQIRQPGDKRLSQSKALASVMIDKTKAQALVAGVKDLQ